MALLSTGTIIWIAFFMLYEVLPRSAHTANYTHDGGKSLKHRREYGDLQQRSERRREGSSKGRPNIGVDESKHVHVNSNSTPLEFSVFLPLLGRKRLNKIVLNSPADDQAEADHNEDIIIERWAAQGWCSVTEELLARAPSGSRAQIYGMVSDSSDCDSQWSATCSHLVCVTLPRDCLLSEYDDIPSMDCIFSYIEHTSKQTTTAVGSNHFVMFANSDMMFPPIEFVSSILSVIHAKIPAGPVLMVGQRTDVMFQHSFLAAMQESPTMKREAYGTWFSDALMQGTRHIDFGVDYFVMSMSLIPRDFPPFLVGRWRWDNALLAEYIVAAAGIPRSVPSATCIDITAAVPVLHLGKAAYSEAISYHSERLGSDYNEALANRHFGLSYRLGRIHNTQFVQVLSPEPRTLDFTAEQPKARMLEVQHRMPEERPDHIVFRALVKAFGATIDSKDAHPPLLLVTVLSHELPFARQFHVQARVATAWWAHSFFFVTMDREIYDALELECPGQVILENERKLNVPFEPIAMRWQTFDKMVTVGRITTAIVTAEQATTHLIGPWHDIIGTKILSCDVLLRNGAVDERDGAGTVLIRPTVEGTDIWNWYKYTSKCKRKNVTVELPPPNLGESRICVF